LLSDRAKQQIALAVNGTMASIAKVMPDMSTVKAGYPFHTVFFSPSAVQAARVERSVVTHLGMTFIPTIAELIAGDKVTGVHRNHRIEGEIDAGSAAAIEAVCGQLRDGRRKPNHQEEMDAILAAKNGRKQTVHVIADLYVEEFTGGPLFCEIKSPMPNLDVCHASKRKIFMFSLLMADRNPQAYLALWYNPYVTRAQYRHNFTRQVMDMDKEVLLGSEMWDKLGGTGTFDALIKLVDKTAGDYRKKHGSA